MGPNPGEDQNRSREPTSHRRARRARGQARVLLRLGSAAGLLRQHHSYSHNDMAPPQRKGSPRRQQNEFCEGVSGKEVVAHGHELSMAGWTCSSSTCGQPGNYPNRRLCRSCGKATAPGVWTSAQQRAKAASAKGSGAKAPWDKDKDKDKGNQPQTEREKQLTKELEDLRAQISQKPAESQTDTADIEMVDKTDSHDREEAEAKEAVDWYRREADKYKDSEPEVSALLRKKQTEADAKWKAFWTPERHRRKADLVLRDKQAKLKKCQADITSKAEETARVEKLLSECRAAEGAARTKEEALKAEVALAEADQKKWEEAAPPPAASVGAGSASELLQAAEQEGQDAEKAPALVKKLAEQVKQLQGQLQRQTGAQHKQSGEVVEPPEPEKRKQRNEELGDKILQAIAAAGASSSIPAGGGGISQADIQKLLEEHELEQPTETKRQRTQQVV